MEAILLPAGVAITVFIVFLLLMPKRIASEEEQRKNAMLGQISSEAVRQQVSVDGNVSLLKEQASGSSSAIYGTLFKIPGAQSTYDLMLKAGLEKKRGPFLLGTLGVFVVLVVLFHLLGMGIVGFFASIGIAVFLARNNLKRRIAKRNKQFLNMFPDAIDMIVRSVRSGHPINTALRMIAENMEPPISDEFRQAMDEVSYGLTISEALLRMSHRIGEQDLHFFVVVLAVQQETGGSLAEVLSNLSSIIRKRRQLRLRIHALTSEGRMTSYILGGLPVAEFFGLWGLNPGYMKPLFETSMGHIMLGLAMVLIVAAMWIVRIMINIDI